MNKRIRRDLDAWEVESLRLTCFSTEPLPQEAQDWWTQVTGEAPEAQVNRPREGRWTVEGPAGGRISAPETRLIMAGQVDRVDWLIKGTESEEVFVTRIGSLPQLVDEFVDLLSGWIAETELKIKRLALGTIVLLPVESHKEGYELLSAYLPLELDPQATDFRYRINRPGVSEILDKPKTINRLQTWGLARYEVIRLEVTSAEATVIGAAGGTEPFFACRLELDVNTAAERTTAIPHESLANALEELKRETLTVAERGDSSHG